MAEITVLTTPRASLVSYTTYAEQLDNKISLIKQYKQQAEEGVQEEGSIGLINKLRVERYTIEERELLKMKELIDSLIQFYPQQQQLSVDMLSQLASVSLTLNNTGYGVDGLDSVERSNLPVPEENVRLWARLPATSISETHAQALADLEKQIIERKEVLFAAVAAQERCTENFTKAEDDIVKATEMAKVCYGCGQPKEKLWLCKQCGVARYCSKECQHAAWGVHKLVCKLLKK